MRTKLKQSPPQRATAPLVEALLRTTCVFTDTLPWQEYLSHVPSHAVSVDIFRRDAARYFCGQQVAARYRSSGTTAAQPAISLFSSEGLLLYKMAAVATFTAVLNRYWGAAAQEAQGVSLLNYSADDSSLATMLRWLAESWSMPCLPYQDLPAHLAKLNPRQPFFLWATRRQLLVMLDSELRVSLPPRAIVIETGGWKNMHNTLNENHFRRRVVNFFQISAHNLCSEYSMCELAAQAWRCGRQSSFMFPVWVQTRVSLDGTSTRRRGTGRLCIYDPLRVDYPWLLCTEDLVSSAGQGLVRLRGRVAPSPLRGCSHDQRLTFYYRRVSKPQLTRSYAEMSPLVEEERRHKLVQACEKFIGSRASVTALGMELGSECVARDALRGLLAGFPDDWEAALLRSYPQPQLRNWLFVLPQNHSLTGIYPLMFAALLRLQVLVKMPPDLEYLNRFIAFLNTRTGAGIEVITIGHSDLHIPANIDALLCYGSDATLADLRASIDLPLLGFGTHDTVTVTTLDHLLQQPQSHIRDAFHLSRRGCLSSKMLFLVPKPEQKFNATHVKILEENFRVFYGGQLSSASRAQATAERVRYMRDCGAVFCSTACPAFPVMSINNLDFETALPRAAFVLPIVVVRDVAKLKELLRQQLSIKTIVQQGSPAERRYRNGRCFVRTGQAGYLQWDGTHEGQPLFAAHIHSEQRAPAAIVPAPSAAPPS